MENMDARYVFSLVLTYTDSFNSIPLAVPEILEVRPFYSRS